MLNEKQNVSYDYVYINWPPPKINPPKYIYTHVKWQTEVWQMPTEPLIAVSLKEENILGTWDDSMTESSCLLYTLLY